MDFYTLECQARSDDTAVWPLMLNNPEMTLCSVSSSLFIKGKESHFSDLARKEHFRHIQKCTEQL